MHVVVCSLTALTAALEGLQGQERAAALTHPDRSRAVRDHGWEELRLAQQKILLNPQAVQAILIVVRALDISVLNLTLQQILDCDAIKIELQPT